MDLWNSRLKTHEKHFGLFPISILCSEIIIIALLTYSFISIFCDPALIQRELISIIIDHLLVLSLN